MVLDTAVVGAGTVSEAHLSGLTKCPRTALTAVCDLDAERAESKASEYGVEAYSDAETMFERADLDWVHICTSVQSHLPLARVAFKAGVPALIEKPVTANLAEFKELVAASEEYDTQFSVVHQHLYDPAMRTAQRRIEDGDLGTVKAVELVFSGLTTPDTPNRGTWAFDLPGGEFEEGLPHPLYLAISAAGHPVSADAIRAETSCHGQYNGKFSYDSAQMQYRTDSGTFCSATLLSSGVPQRLLRIHGTERTLVVDFVSQSVVELHRNYTDSAAMRVLNNIEWTTGRAKGTIENLYRVAKRSISDSWTAERDISPHYFQFDMEAQAIQNGESRDAAVERARWTIAAMEAIRAAADDGVGTEAEALPQAETADDD